MAQLSVTIIMFVTLGTLMIWYGLDIKNILPLSSLTIVIIGIGLLAFGIFTVRTIRR